jgi:hypothetical protein
MFNSLLFKLGTKWRSVVTFVVGLLYPQGKRRQYVLDKILVRHQTWSGCCEEERNLFNMCEPNHSFALFEPVT